LRRGRRGGELPPGGATPARRATGALEADPRPGAGSGRQAVRAAAAGSASDARGRALSARHAEHVGERDARRGHGPARGLPIAAQPRVRLQDLSDLVWLHPSRHSRPELYRVLRTALESRGLAPTRHRGRRGDIGANVAIAAGDSWALANPAVAALYADTGESIVHRPFVDAPIPLWFALVWPSDSPAPLVQTLVEVARRTVASTARTN